MPGLRARAVTANAVRKAALPTLAAAWRTAALQGGQTVYLVEITAVQIGAPRTVTRRPGVGTRPAAALSLSLNVVSSGASVLRFADTPYISKATDSIGVVPFSARIVTMPTIDRRLQLTPEAITRISASYGSLELANGDGYFDGLLRSMAVGGQKIRVLFGTRNFDTARGIWVDPSYDALQCIFAGTCVSWKSVGDSVQVTIADSLRFLAQPLQASVYGGTGGADGGSSLAGLPKPRARGIVNNVTPVLIDTANLVYQASDGPTQFLAVYEQDYQAFTLAGDYATYAALVAASLSSGSYATCQAQGLFRLANSPANYTITCDLYGGFPSGTYVATAGAILLRTLQEDLSFATAAVNTGSLMSLDAVAPYQTGFWFGATAQAAGDAFDALLIGVGAALATDRLGRVTAYRLGPPTGNVAAYFDTTQILDGAAVQDLPDSVVQPNPVRQVAYARNYTVSSGNSLGAASPTRVQFAAAEYRYGDPWSSAAIALAFPQSPTPDPVKTNLVARADANALAATFGTLWGQVRTLWQIPLSTQPFANDLGQEVLLTYPRGDLKAGRSGIIVGETIDTTNNASKLLVLV